MTYDELRALVGSDIETAKDALVAAAAKLPPFDITRGDDTDAAHLRIARAMAQIGPMS